MGCCNRGDAMRKWRALRKTIVVYLLFLSAAVFATWILVHVSLKYVHPPLSTHGYASHGYLLASAVTLLLGSMLSLYSLLMKESSTFFAILIWLIMIVGVYCCLVVLVRSSTWLNLTGEKDKVHDMERQTIIRFQLADKREEAIKNADEMMQNLMITKHCCGINNALDWSRFNVLADGAGATSSNVTSAKRFIPDHCCVDVEQDCGNEIYDTVMENFYTEAYRQFSHSEELEEVIAGNLTNMTAVKIPDPLDVMIMSEIHILQNYTKEACSQNKSFYLYYHGRVRLGPTGNLIVCKEEEDCEPDKIPYKFLDTAKFCTLVKNPDDPDLHLEDWKKLDLLSKSGKLHLNGCKEHLIKYMDEFAKVSLCYCIIVMIALCWEIGAFHEYYWRFKEIEFRSQDNPSWYQPFLEEEELLRLAEENTSGVPRSQTTRNTKILPTEGIARSKTS